MCGILGTVPNTEFNIFKNALDTLFHRGPDSYGIEIINEQVSLGHRRLSIIDIKNGHQPMFDKEKRYIITFNGEIYNFIEIKKELESLGFIFKTNSDTEVLLNAYIKWKEKCVFRFNGMWAFAIWDNYKKELFLSRDRFGKKPLFYSDIKNKFIFASEMKAIYPFLDKVEVSKEFHWIKENIFLYESTEKCLVRGIKRFPKGSNGIYKNGKLKIYRYWNTLDHLHDVPKLYDEQVEKFRELFFDACKIRMRSNVPIATALSGGLDSSATISAMAHLSKGQNEYVKKDWQHAFVASFPGLSIDETKYARIVTDHISINTTNVNIEPLKYWNNINDYFYKFEELYNTNPIPMLMTYKSIKQSGASVSIDGHGADELFSGYGHILESLFDCKFNIKKIKEILETHIDTVHNAHQFKNSNKWSIYLKYIFKKFIKNLLGKELKSIDSNHKNFKKLDNFSKSLYIIFHETILPTLLRNYDRYSMMNSVEIRMPFMDHRIVSYVNSLPYSSKFGNGYTKKLIRDAMDPYMPKKITWRKHKIGFNSPIVEWMQGDLKDWFSDTVHDLNFEKSDFIENSSQLKSDIMNIVNKNNNSDYDASKCWNKLSPYLWARSILNKNYKYK
jgi:asparagine synthase (glutamine-hydrolysing)